MIKNTKKLRKNNDFRVSSTKKKKKKINFFNLAFFVFVLYFVITFINQSQIIANLNSEITDKEKIVEDYTCKEEKLKSDVEGIDNHEVLLKVVERIARDVYNMVKPNEVIYVEKDNVKNKLMFGVGSNDNEKNSKNNTENNN